MEDKISKLVFKQRSNYKSIILESEKQKHQTIFKSLLDLEQNLIN